MSSKNVDVVLGLFASVNLRDFEAAMDAYADDVVLALHGGLMAASDGAMGKQAVGEWFGDWFRTFDRDYRFEIEEVEDWGGQVLLVATHHGRGRTSGAPISQRGVWVYTVMDGKIVRCDVFPDRDAAVEAAGR